MNVNKKLNKREKNILHLCIICSFDWYGCYVENDVGSCTFPGTPLTTNATLWRHADFDVSNNIIYFCDYSPKRMDFVCFSSNDGSTWNGKA